MKNVNTMNAAVARRESPVEGQIARSPLALSDGTREVGDDFYCLRFRVWYPSFDCAIRTRFRTCPSCSNCEQGRFNLKCHSEAFSQRRRFSHYR